MGGSITVHIYTQAIHRITQIKTNFRRVRAVPRLYSYVRHLQLFSSLKSVYVPPFCTLSQIWGTTFLETLLRSFIISTYVLGYRIPNKVFF